MCHEGLLFAMLWPEGTDWENEVSLPQPQTESQVGQVSAGSKSGPSTHSLPFTIFLPF